MRVEVTAHHRGYVGLMQVELEECLTGRGVADVVIEVYAARSSAHSLRPARSASRRALCVLVLVRELEAHVEEVPSSECCPLVPTGAGSVMGEYENASGRADSSTDESDTFAKWGKTKMSRPSRANAERVISSSSSKALMRRQDS